MKPNQAILGGWRRIIRSFALASFLSASATAAFAADAALASQPSQAASTWIVTLGVGPQVQTAFPGAKSVTVWPTGSFDAHRSGDPEPAFTAQDDGIGVPLLDYGWIKAGPVGRIVPSRGLSSGNGAFYGLPNVNTTVELGIYGELWFMDHLRLHAEVRQGVNGHDGLDANLALDAVEKLGAFNFAIGPRLQAADKQYMKTYFSVTPYQAILNGRVTPYQASGGLASAGAFASIKYDITPAWSATLFGGYNRLVSSAAASPIPNKLGSLNEYTAGVLIAHSFDVTLPF
jgi:outer membrane scaffolding protein for murein synthesis (MipA/OmpV family)